MGGEMLNVISRKVTAVGSIEHGDPLGIQYVFKQMPKYRIYHR